VRPLPFVRKGFSQKVCKSHRTSAARKVRNDSTAFAGPNACPRHLPLSLGVLLHQHPHVGDAAPPAYQVQPLLDDEGPPAPAYGGKGPREGADWNPVGTADAVRPAHVVTGMPAFDAPYPTAKTASARLNIDAAVLTEHRTQVDGPAQKPRRRQ